MTTKRALARNLAYSLTLSDWSRETVHEALTRRLPPSFRKTIDQLSDELLALHPTLFAPPPQSVARTLAGLPAFGRFHRRCKERGIWPAADLTPAQMAPILAFRHLDLPPLTTLSDLADWLLIDIRELDRLADRHHWHERHGDMAVNHYHRRLIPKRTGGPRLIEAPKQRLKAAQRHILHGLLDRLPPHPDCFGFVPNRNCLHGANRHVGEAMVVSFDIQDFFPSLQAGRMYGLFRCLGYPHTVSQTLSALCTTITPPHMLERLAFPARAALRTPHLPQGAPTSPALANQLCHRLDRRLSSLARSLGASYSRYADDLSFSGNAHIAKPLFALVPLIAGDEGFCLNRAKSRAMPATTRQTVTGLTVNTHLNTPRRRFDRLKAVIHACSRPDDTRLTDPAFRTSLLGQIDWVETVNPARGAKLRQLLEKAWRTRFS